MTILVGGGLNSGTNQDQGTTNEDTDTTTVTVSKKSTERERGDLSQVVDNENDSRARTLTRESESFLIGLHCINRAHEGRVESVHRRDEISNTHDHVQLDHAL